MAPLGPGKATRDLRHGDTAAAPLSLFHQNKRIRRDQTLLHHPLRGSARSVRVCNVEPGHADRRLKGGRTFQRESQMTKLLFVVAACAVFAPVAFVTLNQAAHIVA